MPSPQSVLVDLIHLQAHQGLIQVDREQEFSPDTDAASSLVKVRSQSHFFYDLDRVIQERYR